MRCCKNPKKVSISMKHEPVPMKDIQELFLSLSFLLWYSPEVKTSRQSLSNPIIFNRTYEDIVMEFIQNGLKMDSDDIFFYDKHKLPIDIISEYIDSYEGDNPKFKDICVNCQKIYIADTKNLSKPVKFLSHIRNILAHGNFNIVNGLIIGYDKNPRDNKINTIIKLYPTELYKSLNYIDPSNHFGITLEKILHVGFEKLGYKITSFNTNYRYDFILSKDNLNYFIDLKYVSNIGNIRRLIRLEESKSSKKEKHKVIKLIELKGKDVFPNISNHEIKIEEINNNIYIYPGILAELYNGVDIIEKYELIKYGNAFK